MNASDVIDFNLLWQLRDYVRPPSSPAVAAKTIHDVDVAIDIATRNIYSTCMYNATESAAGDA